ncbi:MAG: hypothetical protein A3I44_04335 [Candidatus Sungbacteria bacterium RIFCSPLOWO2_02_FULL_51_17]|uniref:Phosphoribosyltransferase domain-containing protein n=1 Tax=Candidatus Sungbacteria bacterium RIFCSPHIGHO2_02_FULL_51_29 TaxID=1802273 RepID=A0A1G2KW97_9BACT|nr:MAG: hypothetical protein A2676_05895 [Candidatus Sungbacteria bacterium RIFCSPHIGHO2_01_FULL_51_22]OHA03717.1 MAG: hypothetical protein A3C16_03495 [Candidatus Sungbacteria bacterium RIFCSPHIGHO2_02_FULL_51_29]OHA07427.1 MAG: hypothetical protein A3B29_04820 [Candidatus Sungbacteria bacterium RIFCSPLOWO2_01_FULL_51_34]OHA11322.1 MAG: hypothetical protein A3I44_04335 [Candidatus Sungbacteria bacterium RIFCSPLOWO2_02_FULL_51_17]
MYGVVIPALLPRKREFDGVWGPPVGGLVPATILHHALELPYVMSPQSKKTLIIDDIADSGRSLCHYAEHPIVTLFYYQQSIVTPMLWVRRKRYENEWIVFPWEKGGRLK